jgi:alpha-amylase
MIIKRILLSSVLILIIAGITGSICLNSCRNGKQSDMTMKINMLLAGYSEVVNQDWVKNAVIYEVNIRQYTPEGTFNAFSKHLPRLKTLGVDILWLMPIYPIGQMNRKGELGSYYSVKDYKKINPEFGNLEDFKALVRKVHEQGMHIIIDWVPNHTSWDNVLTLEHPDFYITDKDGRFIAPNDDWTDIIQLNYKNKDLRKYMIDAMKYWLTETDIDGFRCDAAHMVPVDFWEETRPELEKVKPVFMLAESEQPELNRRAFDMTYDWPFHHLMNDIAAGRKTANAISTHFSKVDSIYPIGSILMQFTSNHDENYSAGTEYERLDGGAKTFAVLAATVPGMPLIYNGQEVGMNKRLRFFEKDTIPWKESEMTDFYKKLISLKHRNEALWNGKFGGTLTRITSTNNKAVYAFLRENGKDRVFVVLNLTKEPAVVTLKGKLYRGNYRDVFSGSDVSFRKDESIALQPWDFRVYEKNE